MTKPQLILSISPDLEYKQLFSGLDLECDRMRTFFTCRTWNKNREYEELIVTKSLNAYILHAIGSRSEKNFLTVSVIIINFAFAGSRCT